MSRKTSSFVLFSLESRSMFSAGFDIAPIHNGGDIASPIVMDAAAEKTPVVGNWYAGFMSEGKRAGRIELSIKSQTDDGLIAGNIALSLNGKPAETSRFTGVLNANKQTLTLSWAERRSFTGSISATVHFEKGALVANVSATVGGQTFAGQAEFTGETSPTRVGNTDNSTLRSDLDGLLA